MGSVTGIYRLNREARGYLGRTGPSEVGQHGTERPCVPKASSTGTKAFGSAQRVTKTMINAVVDHRFQRTTTPLPTHR